MPRDNKAQSHFSLPIVITNLLVFVLLGLTIGFIDICVLKRTPHPIFSDQMIVGIGASALVFTSCLYGFYLFIEYKFNRLKFKNIFLYLGIAIALVNFIAVISLPSHMSLPNDAELTITPLMRTYYIFAGFFYAILPYLYFYLIPRKITNRRYLDKFFYFIIGFALLTIVISFITDWEHYLNIFKNHDLVNNAISSFFPDKASFSFTLLSAIFASIYLRINHHNYKWIIFVIPLYLFLILGCSSIIIVSTTLIILIYIITQLVLVCKKSRDNLIITLLVVGFFLALGSLFIVGLVRSDGGVLGDIKETILKVVDHTKTTMNSRILIWQTAFKLLSSWRVIFGYGIDSFDLILHQAYTQVAPSFDMHIYATHNFVIEMLGNGGIFLLGIYLFIYAYFVYMILKLRKREPWFVTSTLIFLFMFTFISMFTPNCLCAVFMDFIASVTIILPIMSKYYTHIDKDENTYRKELANNIKTINDSKPQSRLMKLNKKFLLQEAVYIAYDLNIKIKL